jgi:hypothetical protein
MTLHKKDIHIAVAVVIEQGNAGAHDLGHVVFSARARVMDEIERYLAEWRRRRGFAGVPTGT